MIASVTARVSSGRHARAVDWGTGALSAVVALSSVAAGARNGGYFPTSWGWLALLFAWFALLAIVLRPRVMLSPGSLAFLVVVTVLIGWTFLTATWSISPGASIDEGQRGLVYAAAAAGLVLVVGRLGAAALCSAMLVGIAGICVYALSTRLFPGQIGSYDPIATYRLAVPLGYWNALGLTAALSSLIALGIAAHGKTLAGRALASGSLVVLLSTLYFTFSRGAWLALVVGLFFLVVIDPRRLHTAAAMLAVAPAPALAVLLASRQGALTTQGAKAALATAQGHRVAAAVPVLCLLAALFMAIFVACERTWTPTPLIRRAFALLLAAALLAVGGGATVRWGSPWQMSQRAWNGFTAGPLAIDGNLNNRLFHLSNNGRLVSWESALREWQHAPIVGTGAGTFETWWVERRATDFQIRDAHSLYLETLGELGLVGLVLLAGVVVVPLWSAVRRRRHPLVPFAAAGFVAWAFHAGIDWDWEVPAVTLPALACAVVCCSGTRRREIRIGTKGRVVIGTFAVAVAAFSLVFAIGNQALASSQNALDSQNYAKADSEAKKAARWAPWLPDPWIIRGQIAALGQDLPTARADFHKAIRKDSRSYLAWYGLAGVEHGAAREHAVAQVVRLNPLSDEAKELKSR